MCQKDEKENFKKYSRFSPDFTHFSLKHNGYKKKTSLSNSRKIACWFFSKVHNFLKMWWKSNIFSRGHSTSLELLWNKKSWWSYLTSAPQIKKTKKKTSLSTVQMTLKTLLFKQHNREWNTPIPRKFVVVKSSSWFNIGNMKDSANVKT